MESYDAFIAFGYSSLFFAAFVLFDALSKYFKLKNISLLYYFSNAFRIVSMVLSFIPFGIIQILKLSDVVPRGEKDACVDCETLSFETSFSLPSKRDALRNDLSRLESVSIHCDEVIMDLESENSALKTELMIKQSLL